MSNSKPVLYLFSNSHYCVKARWALDHHKIDHDLVFWAPGQHRIESKKLGLKTASVPILQINDEIIQGSSLIIDWAEGMGVKRPGSLTPEGLEDECLSIEERADNILGVYVRRFYYSEALYEHPNEVRRILFKGVPIFWKIIGRIKWKEMRSLMIERMGATLESIDESQKIIEAELDWLDTLLKDGRKYLVGNQFTRADMTIASLLSPLTRPSKNAHYQKLPIPPRIGKIIEEWSKRPSIIWAREIYDENR